MKIYALKEKLYNGKSKLFTFNQKGKQTYSRLGWFVSRIKEYRDTRRMSNFRVIEIDLNTNTINEYPFQEFRDKHVISVDITAKLKVLSRISDVPMNHLIRLYTQGVLEI